MLLTWLTPPAVADREGQQRDDPETNLARDDERIEQLGLSGHDEGVLGREVRARRGPAVGRLAFGCVQGQAACGCSAMPASTAGAMTRWAGVTGSMYSRPSRFLT